MPPIGVTIIVPSLPKQLTSVEVKKISKLETTVVSIGPIATVSNAIESVLFTIWQTIAEPHWLIVLKQTSNGSVIPSKDN